MRYCVHNQARVRKQAFCYFIGMHGIVLFVAAKLGFDEGESVVSLILPGDYVRARITKAHQYDLDAIIENQQE